VSDSLGNEIAVAITRRDPQFAARLRGLLAAVDGDAASGATANTVTGDVAGHVVQTRDVYGGVTLGRADDTPGG
jgi:hypothetical protein